EKCPVVTNHGRPAQVLGAEHAFVSDLLRSYSLSSHSLSNPLLSIAPGSFEMFLDACGSSSVQFWNPRLQHVFDSVEVERRKTKQLKCRRIVNGVLLASCRKTSFGRFNLRRNVWVHL